MSKLNQTEFSTSYKLITFYAGIKYLMRTNSHILEVDYNFGLGENRRLPTKLATETRQESVTEEKYISNGIRGQSHLMSVQKWGRGWPNSK